MFYDTHTVEPLIPIWSHHPWFLPVLEFTTLQCKSLKGGSRGKPGAECEWAVVRELHPWEGVWNWHLFQGLDIKFRTLAKPSGKFSSFRLSKLSVLNAASPLVATRGCIGGGTSQLWLLGQWSHRLQRGVNIEKKNRHLVKTETLVLSQLREAN